MRVAMTVLFACLMVTIGLLYFLFCTIVNGPLNPQKFFSEHVEAEFNHWSQALLGSGYCCEDGLMAKDYRHFIRRYGISSAPNVSEESSVDWRVYAGSRMFVHYVCKISDRGEPTWDFWLESRTGLNRQDLLSMLEARKETNGKIFQFAIIGFASWCCLLSLCMKCKFGVAIPRRLRITIIFLTWMINLFAFFVMLVSGVCSVQEWLLVG